MKIPAAILAWMIVATDVMATIAMFLLITVILGFSVWLFGGSVRDLYKHIRVKFVPLEGRRHAA